MFGWLRSSPQVLEEDLPVHPNYDQDTLDNIRAAFDAEHPECPDCGNGFDDHTAVPDPTQPTEARLLCTVYGLDPRVHPVDGNGEPVSWFDDPQFIRTTDGASADYYDSGGIENWGLNTDEYWIAYPRRNEKPWRNSQCCETLDDALEFLIGDPQILID